MEVNFTPQTMQKPYFTGNWFAKIDKAIGKFIVAPAPSLTVKNQDMLMTVEEIARSKYDSISGLPVNLSVKNSNKEFNFKFNNSVWHRVSLTKKGEELADFEILHIKNDKVFEFYSTGGYPSKIIDKKFISKFNGILEEWMPRLIKRCEKLERKQNIVNRYN